MNKRKETESSKGQQSAHRVTYRDIAQALGVSKMTVSYSLRNDPRISEATRLRVQQKATEMNYQPDPMLSALSAYRHESQSTGTKAALAWINFYQPPEKLREHKVFDLYWRGAADAAAQLGYHLQEFQWNELSLSRMHSIFKARGIRGILLPPTPQGMEPGPEELSQFPWKDYALARFGESLRSLKVNYVSSAQVPNTIQAFEQIQEKGYERIGFVGQHLRHRLFSAGYLWAQQALPRSQQLSPLFLQADDLPQKQALLEKWMKSQKPDAIICGAPNIFQSLEKLGYRIPSDLGLVSMSKYDNPINAGIDQNPEEIGRTATRSLVSQLNEHSFGIPASQKEILVQGKWVDGSMMPRRKT